MWENKNMPKFGPLSGLKVAHATLAQAGPFAGVLFAELGADVIWIENALTPDITRFSRGYYFEQDRRNQRNIALNIPTPEGKEVFLNLLKDTDIFFENSKGGQYADWGLTDEVLWEANPKLVIAHISGFGQTGLPEYVNRPAYDKVIQAHTGYSFINSNSATPPYATSMVSDYIASFFTVMSTLAAVHKAKETGIGESIDVAQAEVLMRMQLYMADWFSSHRIYEKFGYPSAYAGCEVFKTKDGHYFQTFYMGVGVLKKSIPLVGLEYGSEDYPKGISILLSNTEQGKCFTEAVRAYIAERNIDEVVEVNNRLGLPGSKINTYEDVEKDPHVAAREMITEWESFKGVKIRGVSPVPKFKNNPLQVWRAAPYQGMDNEEILGELGYSAEKIKELYDQKIIVNDEEMKFCIPFPS